MGEWNVLVRVVVDHDTVYAIREGRPVRDSLEQEVHLRRSRESHCSEEVELAARTPVTTDHRACTERRIVGSGTCCWVITAVNHSLPDLDWVFLVVVVWIAHTRRGM